MVGVHEKVFSTGNVFRAEKHSTTRHLNEYTSLDAEFGFIKDLFSSISKIRDLLHNLSEGNSKHADSSPLLLLVAI